MDHPATACSSRHGEEPGANPDVFPDRASGELVAAIRPSLGIESHTDLQHWLQGDLQALLPHQALIAARGDFASGALQYDIISALPGATAVHLGDPDFNPVAGKLFHEWLQRGAVPFASDAPIAVCVEAAQPIATGAGFVRSLTNTGASLVHGIRDRRSNDDCLYIAFNAVPGMTGQHCDMFAFLLPFIDTALRRIGTWPAQSGAALVAKVLADVFSATDPASSDSPLTGRELEIMDWVSRGKTNPEIGIILDISAFTVKNHLQRIFRKLGAANRAQAVALFEHISHHLPPS